MAERFIGSFGGDVITRQAIDGTSDRICLGSRDKPPPLV